MPPMGRHGYSLVRGRARRPRGAPAVNAGELTLSYGELAARARALAARLRAAGVGAEDLVALAVERSPDMVVGALAILEAGAAYVPLDPRDPRERLAFLLADTGAAALLTEARLAGALPEGQAPVLLLDESASAGGAA